MKKLFLGFKKIFYGKEFENVCCNGDTSFLNPNERMINYIKGAIDVRRQHIDKNKI